MENKKRGMSKNCGCDLARPYVNDQKFTKMYSLSSALNNSEMYNADLYKNPKNRVRGKR